MYGRQVQTTHVIYPTRCSYDGVPEYKAGGLTIDWTTVAAAAATDTTLPDGSIVRAGSQFARYGQVWAKISASGKYGPFDPAAADGRQVLVRGECFVQDETLVSSTGNSILPRTNEIRGGVTEGGRIWIARILNSGTAAHSLAAGPTLAEFMAAFPRFLLVENG